MNGLRQVVKSFKSDLLTKCVKRMAKMEAVVEVYEEIHKNLYAHFGIERSCFLKKESDGYHIAYNSFAKVVNDEPISHSLIEPFFLLNQLERLPEWLAQKETFAELTHMVRLKSDEVESILLFKNTPQFQDFLQSDELEDTVNTIVNVFLFIEYYINLRKNENQYRKLYTMTELFHSTMDIDRILQNVLYTIEENFPDLQCELILSNDQDRHTTIKIKPFDYLSERPSTIEAFVSGELTIEKATDLSVTIINAPIKGRQAIYGILQVRAPQNYKLDKRESNFICMLAQASGNALENAKLYHQSHRLISDLQLINETSHRLNMRLNIDEMLVFLQKQLVKSFQPTELAFVFKVNDQFEVTTACTNIFKTQAGRVYLDHVEKHFDTSQDPLFIADFSRLVTKDYKYKSMMAIPMIVEEKINGYSVVLHEDPYFFSFDSFKLMQSLIHHSSLAISNSILRNQLQEMVDRDHLTQLYARNYLDSFVEKSLGQDESGMFLLIDIDNFKLVNDTYGHHIGDQVLVQISTQLRKLIGTRGICARWGGEELSVYIPNILDSEAIKIAQSLVDNIPKATEPRVTISAGMITWNRHAKPEFKSIFMQADAALYTAKKNGKNQFCVFDNSMQLQS